MFITISDQLVLFLVINITHLPMYYSINKDVLYLFILVRKLSYRITSVFAKFCIPCHHKLETISIRFLYTVDQICNLRICSNFSVPDPTKKNQLADPFWIYKRYISKISHSNPRFRCEFGAAAVESRGRSRSRMSIPSYVLFSIWSNFSVTWFTVIENFRAWLYATWLIS